MTSGERRQTGGARREELGMLWTACASLTSAAATAIVLFLASSLIVSQMNCGAPPLIRRLQGIRCDLVSRTCAGGTAVLGSSIGLEGVDCDVVSRQDGALGPCRNYSRGGATPRQWLLLLPDVVTAAPRRVVLSADVSALGGSTPIPTEVLVAAAAWDVRSVHRDPCLRAELTPQELAQLGGGPIATIARYRLLPLMAMDTFARETVRSDLRFAGHLQNFTAPWVRRSDVSGQPLNRHVAMVADGIASYTSDGIERSLKLLRTQAMYLHNRGIVVVGVVSPVHPAVRDAVGDSRIRELTARMLTAFRAAGAEPVDDTRLLVASEFGDAVHPNAKGRAKWSEALGQSLRAWK